MTAKEYLEQLPDMRIRIKAIRQRINEFKERASDTAAKLSDQHSSSGVGKVEGNVMRAVDIEAQLKEIVQEFEEFELRASQQISKLPTGIYSSLLFNRYINGMTWEDIAEEIDKGVEYVRTELHSKALAEFSLCYPDYPRLSPCILPKKV